MSLSCPQLSAYKVYKPRKPETTVLFKVVKKHFLTWTQKNDQHIPFHVEKEFHEYLKCGILAHGFAHAHCKSCEKNYMIPFSCKRRGLCPSCSTKRMVKTGAHLSIHVFPRVPFRQWVISFPKRIRPYLNNVTILQAVIDIVSEEIKQRLVICSPQIPEAQFGGVSFIQRFGSKLNFHPHLHLCFADGVFGTEDNKLHFCNALITLDDVQDTEDRIRQRVLKLFGRRGWIPKEQIDEMLKWEYGGFSLDARVRVEAWDREGLERLIRYCARPIFASENLKWNYNWLVYHLSKPTHDSVRSIQMTTEEFFDKLAKLIPPPRRHLHHYHGVFASNAPKRKWVTAYADQMLNEPKAYCIKKTAEKVTYASLTWAKLITRIYEVDPLQCSCGKRMKIIGFVTNPYLIRKILSRQGLPTVPPEFDPPIIREWNVCQLFPGTTDGFYDEGRSYYDADFRSSVETCPDPPDVLCQLIPGSDDGFIIEPENISWCQ